MKRLLIFGAGYTVLGSFMTGCAFIAGLQSVVYGHGLPTSFVAGGMIAFGIHTFLRGVDYILSARKQAGQ